MSYPGLIGTHDRARSNHLVQAETLKNRIPGAELKVLDGQSHGFFWQAPEETNQIILDWVKRHSHRTWKIDLVIVIENHPCAARSHLRVYGFSKNLKDSRQASYIAIRILILRFW